jgi:hypothetical protein
VVVVFSVEGSSTFMSSSEAAWMTTGVTGIEASSSTITLCLLVKSSSLAPGANKENGMSFTDSSSLSSTGSFSVSSGSERTGPTAAAKRAGRGVEGTSLGVENSLPGRGVLSKPTPGATLLLLFIPSTVSFILSKRLLVSNSSSSSPVLSLLSAAWPGLTGERKFDANFTGDDEFDAANPEDEDEAGAGLDGDIPGTPPAKKVSASRKALRLRSCMAFRSSSVSVCLSENTAARGVVCWKPDPPLTP